MEKEGKKGCGCADCKKAQGEARVPGPAPSNPCANCRYQKGSGSNDGVLTGTLKDNTWNGTFGVWNMTIELKQGTTSLNTYTGLSPDGGSASGSLGPQTISGSGTYNGSVTNAYLRFKQAGVPEDIGPYSIPVDDP